MKEYEATKAYNLIEVRVSKLRGLFFDMPFYDMDCPEMKRKGVILYSPPLTIYSP